jgi:hypothetical protein
LSALWVSREEELQIRAQNWSSIIAAQGSLIPPIKDGVEETLKATAAYSKFITSKSLLLGTLTKRNTNQEAPDRYINKEP